ncbi:MAG: hypothetical protein V4463_11050 [Pseudomonadota bacterium]
MLRRPVLLIFLLLATLLGACGGGGGTATPAPSPVVTPPPQASASADISVLMFGNSHTSVSGLSDMLEAMLRAGRPGKTVAVVVAPDYLFLDERMSDPESHRLLDSQKWSALVLQAQKYSASGLFDYPIDSAVEWVRQARAKGTLPVMFPEWSRRGIDETARIYDLHVSIAQKQPACVAPIPQAWDLAALRIPGVVLHADDGNHSAPNGAYLAALILYAALTGDSPATVADLQSFGVTGAMQVRLRAVADEQVHLVAPRLWCPNDPTL